MVNCIVFGMQGSVQREWYRDYSSLTSCFYSIFCECRLKKILKRESELVAISSAAAEGRVSSSAVPRRSTIDMHNISSSHEFKSGEDNDDCTGSNIAIDTDDGQHSIDTTLDSSVVSTGGASNHIVEFANESIRGKNIYEDDDLEKR